MRFQSSAFPIRNFFLREQQVTLQFIANPIMRDLSTRRDGRQDSAKLSCAGAVVRFRRRNAYFFCCDAHARIFKQAQADLLAEDVVTCRKWPNVMPFAKSTDNEI
jgi:hypothetical protein